jgi:hypothetical protein
VPTTTHGAQVYPVQLGAVLGLGEGLQTLVLLSLLELGRPEYGPLLELGRPEYGQLHQHLF